MTVTLLPLDDHNVRLLANVHPPAWVNPVAQDRYDLIVIGAGTGGLVSAAGAAGLGARVALIERHLMGGDCLNVGCVPSKGLIAASRAWHAARHGDAFGAPVATGAGDFAAVVTRMRQLRANLSAIDGAERFRGLGVDVFFGNARFDGSDTVVVNEQRLRFRRAVIATGARAGIPPIPGLAEADFLTNESVFTLTERPDRLLVLGGGPIGCELGQTFARFGSRVTIIDASARILPRDDPDASASVHRALAADGVSFELGVAVQRVERRSRSTVVHVVRDGATVAVEGDRLLVAAGRAPNVEELDLEKAGVAYTRRGITVNDHLRSTNRRVYAVGDVAGGPQFTHAADFQARLVIANALFFGRGRASRMVVPWATYTSPEVAHVGLTPGAAASAGINIETITVPLADVDRAVLDGEADGFLKVHLRRGTDRIVGVTVVASHAGDLIGEAAVAITNGLRLSQLGRTIHPYPTQAEAYRKAADVWRRTKLTPVVRRLLGGWFRLFR
jgi:pyruvate/2-oxoglutarate dehydrogenase complex dihydrolipoamide dehydrogenase (E3) component